MNNRTRTKGDSLAMASLICGILGCVIMCSVVFSIFFGALAIILALLARGNSFKITRNCRAGFILGIIAIICSVIIFVISIYSVIAPYGSLGAFFDEVMLLTDQALNQMYGIGLDEMMQLQ